MKRVSRGEAWTGLADCRNCRIRASALFAGLEEDDFERIHQPIDQLVYPAGAEIYASGDDATALYTIRSGLVKLTRYLPDGGQRIVRLLRKTDVAELDALVSGVYQHNAVALRETEVCRLPIPTVKALCDTTPRLYHELMSRWHRALSDADRWIAELSTGSARDRVVRLLLWLSEVEEQPGCELFSREDLGAVLGLTTETASRVMAELKRQGFISEPKPNKFLCDIPNLERLVS